MAKMTAFFQLLAKNFKNQLFSFWGSLLNLETLQKKIWGHVPFWQHAWKHWKLVELSFHFYIRPKVSCMEGKMAKMTAFFRPLVKNFFKSTFSIFFFLGVYSEYRKSVEKNLRACLLLATYLKNPAKLYETRWIVRYVAYTCITQCS